MPIDPRLSPEHQSSHDKGYEDGFEGRGQRSEFYCFVCYAIGYASGKSDREEVQRANSSNT